MTKIYVLNLGDVYDLSACDYVRITERSSGGAVYVVEYYSTDDLSKCRATLFLEARILVDHAGCVSLSRNKV